MSVNQLAEEFVAAAVDVLAEGMHKIEHCLAQLTDEQVWWRPKPSNSTAGASSGGAEMNSIANLMLHLTGNVRQWIISGVGGAKDIRNRPWEFADRSQRATAEILAQLKATVDEALAIIGGLSEQKLVVGRRIQGFDTNVVEALFGTIAHFRGHAQEIIHLTRQQLGDRYRFDFVPHGPEQESAGKTI